MLRKPPYGISRWDWYIAPQFSALLTLLSGRCRSCGLKQGHKFSCSVIK